MSDEPTPKPEDAPADPAQDPPKPTPADVPPKAPKADTDWQAEARKWEQRAKENTGAAKRLKEFEDRDKTEVEKLTERANKAEEAASKALREALRHRIAAETNVEVDLLAGDDEEAMRAHASRLLSWRGEAKPVKPKPDPTQGARGAVDLDAEIAEAEAKGDVRASIALKNRKLQGAVGAK